jgi:hypothetical protein
MGDQMSESVLVEKPLPMVVFSGGEGFETEGNAYQEGSTAVNIAADA